MCLVVEENLQQFASKSKRLLHRVESKASHVYDIPSSLEVRLSQEHSFALRSGDTIGREHEFTFGRKSSRARGCTI